MPSPLAVAAVRIITNRARSPFRSAFYDQSPSLRGTDHLRNAIDSRNPTLSPLMTSKQLPKIAEIS